MSDSDEDIAHFLVSCWSLTSLRVDMRDEHYVLSERNTTKKKAMLEDLILQMVFIT